MRTERKWLCLVALLLSHAAWPTTAEHGSKHNIAEQTFEAGSENSHGNNANGNGSETNTNRGFIFGMPYMALPSMDFGALRNPNFLNNILGSLTPSMLQPSNYNPISFPSLENLFGGLGGGTSAQLGPQAAQPIHEPPEPQQSAPIALSPASVLGCGQTPGGNPFIQMRIIGGKESRPHSWPFIVAVKIGKGLCGGSLIRPDIVVTAAHCIIENGYAYGEVIAGAHDLYSHDMYTETIAAIQYLPHPLYDLRTKSNDIGLIRLARPLAMDYRKQPICLPAPGQFPPPGTRCYVVGWGAVASDAFQTKLPTRLRQATVPILQNNECNGWQHYSGAVKSTMFCAGTGAADTCEGDSGGPLVCKSGQQWVLTGITSWGYGCARTQFPGVYTKVAAYSSWIYEQLAQLGRLRHRRETPRYKIPEDKDKEKHAEHEKGKTNHHGRKGKGSGNDGHKKAKQKEKDSPSKDKF